MEESKKPLEIGNLVRIKPRGAHSFKIIGFSESGSLAFLQPVAFLDRPRNEHAIAWYRYDLLKTS